jgi:hypothetical protein
MSKNIIHEKEYFTIRAKIQQRKIPTVSGSGANS